MQGAEGRLSFMEKSPADSYSQGMLAWSGLLLGWFVPGAGFMIHGRWARGLAHFIVVTVTFCIGLAFRGSVIWPSWSIRSEDFNLINNFTFVVQLGGGVLAVASFFASLAQETGSSIFAWLAGSAQFPYAELGGYFLIVAGALNYFAIGNYYDRIVSPHPRFVAQDTPQGEQSG